MLVSGFRSQGEQLGHTHRPHPCSRRPRDGEQCWGVHFLPLMNTQPYSGFWHRPQHPVLQPFFTRTDACAPLNLYQASQSVSICNASQLEESTRLKSADSMYCSVLLECRSLETRRCAAVQDGMRVDEMFVDSDIWPELSGSDHCPSWTDLQLKGELPRLLTLPAFSTRNTFTGGNSSQRVCPALTGAMCVP